MAVLHRIEHQPNGDKKQTATINPWRFTAG